MVTSAKSAKHTLARANPARNPPGDKTPESMIRAPAMWLTATPNKETSERSLAVSRRARSFRKKGHMVRIFSSWTREGIDDRGPTRRYYQPRPRVGDAKFMRRVWVCLIVCVLVGPDR